MAVTWGTKTALTTQTAINETTEEFMGYVAMSTAMVCHLEILVNNESGSVTNGVIINLYGTLDDSTEDVDDAPFLTRTFTPASINEEKFSLFISGVYKFRVGAKAVAATDDYTVGANYRLRTA